MTPKQLREQSREHVEAADAIVQAADSEGSRSLTAEEQTSVDEHLANHDRLQAEASAIEANEARLDRLAAARAALTPPAPGNTPSPFQPTNVPIPNREPADDFRASDGRYTVPASVKRWGSLKNFSGPNADVSAYRFGQFALAVAGSESGIAYCNAYGIPLSVHKESVNSTGGVLVPEEFDNGLIDLRETYGVARRLCRISPMSSDTKTRRRRTGGLTANFEGEVDSGSESTKSWDFVTLTAKKLMVLSTMSTELNEDAVISVGDDLAGEVAYAFANKEDDCFLNGDGTSTYGGILGLVTRLQDIDGAGTDANALVTQATGSTWGAIVIADFHSVIAQLPQYADTPNTRWLCHRAFWAGVMQPLQYAAGGATPEHLAAGPQRSFLGYPVEITQVMPSVTAVSTVSAILGDYMLSSDFGDRRQTTIAFSQDATIGSTNMFESDATAIRGTERFDINNHDLGTSSANGPVAGLQTDAS